LLVGAVVGGNINASRSTTGEPEVAPVEPTRVRTRVATGESDLSGLPHDYKLQGVDLRVGDCFDLKDEFAYEIEDIKAVPCTTEHEFEVFYVGAMGKGGYPYDDAFGAYVTQNCNSAFSAYIGKAHDESDVYIYWLAPTEDAWRSGDRTVLCAAYYPRIDRLTHSLRGTKQ
jgi:Septum formation